MEERKFVCKYCCKRFPCGKSLGGHIRTHMTEERSTNAALAAAAAAADSDTLLNLDGVRNKRDLLWSHQPPAAVGGTGNGNPNIYGLRENPKKTMRFVHSHAAAAANLVLEQDEKFCKECGKGFPSLKALCGHMASHSDKDKRINKFEDTSEKDKSVMYTSSQSDSDSCAPTRRSRRMRFKSLTLPNHNHPSSSLVSEVEQEQEEVARCLMLLSKDSSHTLRGRFASESNSDNNSVVVEAKSSSLETKFAIINGNNFVEKKAIKDIKLKSIGVGVSNNSDSRCFRYGSKIKIVDSDVSNYEFKRPKVEDKSGFEDCRSKYNVTVFKKSGMKDLDYDRKRANYDSLGHNLVGNGNGNGKIANGWKYESLVSERDNGSYDLTDESDENSSETDSFPAPRSHKSKAVNRKKSSKAKKKLKSKKSKEYECPICYKIFRSGQALGGHKRSHFVGGFEENTLVIKQAAPPPPVPVPCLIDLNLPAPVDE